MPKSRFGLLFFARRFSRANMAAPNGGPPKLPSGAPPGSSPNQPPGGPVKSGPPKMGKVPLNPAGQQPGAAPFKLPPLAGPLKHPGPSPSNDNETSPLSSPTSPGGMAAFVVAGVGKKPKGPPPSSPAANNTTSAPPATSPPKVAVPKVPPPSAPTESAPAPGGSKKPALPPPMTPSTLPTPLSPQTAPTTSGPITNLPPSPRETAPAGEDELAGPTHIGLKKVRFSRFLFWNKTESRVVQFVGFGRA